MLRSTFAIKMNFPRPSYTILFGVTVVLLAIIALFFSREEATESLKNQDSKGQLNQGSEGTTRAFFRSRKSLRSNKADKIENLIRERFSDAQQETFYHGFDGLAGESYEGYGGDLADGYREKGLMNLYGEMRSALRGSEDSIAEIFTTYSSEAEQ